jgi:hypothetical protein
MHLSDSPLNTGHLRILHYATYESVSFGVQRDAHPKYSFTLIVEPPPQPIVQSRYASSAAEIFNHGWTRMDTDEEERQGSFVAADVRRL